jgi:excisionase family DNA binding protein
MNLNDLITQAEAARLRNVSRSSVNELVKKGRFKTVEIGGQIFLLRSQVERYEPSAGGRPSKNGSKKNR